MFSILNVLIVDFNFSQLKTKKVLQKMKLICIFYLPLLTYMFPFFEAGRWSFLFLYASIYIFIYLRIYFDNFNIKDQGPLWQYSRMGSVMQTSIRKWKSCLPQAVTTIWKTRKQYFCHKTTKAMPTLPTPLHGISAI